MNTLKQRMDGIKKMMGACMNMQRELQRSMQQEIYSALNRSSNSRGLLSFHCNFTLLFLLFNMMVVLFLNYDEWVKHVESHLECIWNA